MANVSDATRPVKPQRRRTEADVAPVLSADPPRLLDPGLHQAIFTRAERRAEFGGQKLRLWFQVLGREGYPVAELFMVCPLRPDGSAAAGGKFARQWRLLAGRSPRRGERLTVAVFRHRILEVKIRTVELDHRQQPLGAVNQYSVIDAVVGVAAGGRAR